MGFRFFRRIRIAPGLTVNLSKSGASLSIGPRGAKYTIGPRGSRTTIGLPGTGLFYTVQHGKRVSAGATAATSARKVPLPAPERAVRPADRPFVEGLHALADGRNDDALVAFEQIASRPDAAWAAGLLRLHEGDFPAARRHLEHALAGVAELGTLAAEYCAGLEVALPVTTEVTAHVTPGERSTRLALAEVAQHQGDRRGALEQLSRLRALDPADPVARLSFAELALDDASDTHIAGEVAEMTADTANETAIDTALLLYRARALAGLGLRDGAVEVLTQALRRRKDRPAALMAQIRHDRAELYDQLGRMAEARREYERLFTEDPDFPGLRERLGLAG